MKDIRLSDAVACVAALGLQAAMAQPKPPEGAKQLTSEQITQQLSNRTFKFVVHDAAAQITETSTWDPVKAIAYGDYVMASSPGQWKKEWKVMDGKNCFRDPFAKSECYRVFLEGQVHCEVRDDGLVHSTNTLVAK